MTGFTKAQRNARCLWRWLGHRNGAWRRLSLLLCSLPLQELTSTICWRTRYTDLRRWVVPFKAPQAQPLHPIISHSDEAGWFFFKRIRKESATHGYFWIFWKHSLLRLNSNTSQQKQCLEPWSVWKILNRWVADCLSIVYDMIILYL